MARIKMIDGNWTMVKEDAIDIAQRIDMREGVQVIRLELDKPSENMKYRYFVISNILYIE